MKNPSSTSIHVNLRSDQVGPLRHLAERRHVTVPELIRQGVDKILAEMKPEEDSLWDIIGMVKTGPEDLAEKHDEYLTKWLHEENH